MPALIYTPVGWVEDVTPTSAANFNQMEAGIVAATNAINSGGGGGTLQWPDVQVATTNNVNIASPGGNIIDAIGLVNGDRVLLAGQTTPSQNGIYIFNGSSSAMTRALDAAASSDFIFGRQVFVASGGANWQTLWHYRGTSSPTIGTTSLAFRIVGRTSAGQQSVIASSTVAQGPGATGADVTYDQFTATLFPGTWLIFGGATMRTTVADGKQLALWNNTLAAEVPNSRGTVDGTGVADMPMTCEAFLAVPSSATAGYTLKLYGKRNGGSGISWGYGGTTMLDEQFIKALRIA